MQSLRLFVVLNLLICATVSIDEEAKAFLELTEFAYEDSCSNVADVQWAFINSPYNQSLLSLWEERQIADGAFKKAQKDDVINTTASNSRDPSLKYKYNVIVKAGDALLNHEDWERFVHFTVAASHLKKTATYSTKTENFSRIDVERLLSQNGEVESKRDAWAGWYRQLSPLVANFSRTLPLVARAAELNGFNNVREYWENLSGYTNGYRKLEYEWTKVSRLHRKLITFAQEYLSHKYEGLMNETIPAHLLGTLQGYDWSTMTIEMMPYTDLTYTIRKNLWKQKLVGKSLYKAASSMGMTILKKVPEADFWENSHFNQECPSDLINFCKEGIMRVSTCFEATISNFLSAHKNIGKVVLNQMSTSDTPILNIANRYSGIEEGVSELFGIFSASPVWLNNMHLMENSDNNEERQIVSLMITALDVLPRLAYYYSAEMWRLNALEKNITDPTELLTSWWEHRENYEGITSDFMDIPTFLDDNYVIKNQPYFSKIAGVLIAFQMYDYLMESTEVRYKDLQKKDENGNFMKMIQQGAAENWMKILSKHLEIYEIYADSLVSFFSPLEDFLDEMQEEFNYTLGITEESALENLKNAVIEEINMPSTTPSTTTLRITKARVTTADLTTVPSTIVKNNQKDEPSKVEKSLQSESSVQTPKPADYNTSKLKEPSKDPFENSISSDTIDNEDDNKPKINTSKAVWAVSAVLIATVTICIIAIFGRQRCRKTPKNRRYV